MNPKVRLGLYVVLLGCMAACATGFLLTYRSAGTPANAAGGTNVAASSTNLVLSTNAAGVVQSNLMVTTTLEPTEDVTQRHSSPRIGRLVAYGIALFFMLVFLAVLLGHDISKFVANRVDTFIFNDDLEGVKNPEYEEAERVWASGNYLDSIQLMRDYLKKHPREQYVALRIAEIYEADLRNYLAAALEYEEVLKKRLPAERWGWAAIHLSNLYSGKLNQPEHATELLRRIVEDYGQTAAARKARERLGIPEPIVVSPEPAPAPEPAPEPVRSQPSPPASNLPPGFRPKD